MSGIWTFKDGVYRREEVLRRRASDGTFVGGSMTRKEMVHLPTGKVVTSYDFLEEVLTELGWERYLEGNKPELFQFHKPPTIDLISLPRNFTKFNSIHMYDIVIKAPGIFLVRDI